MAKEIKPGDFIKAEDGLIYGEVLSVGSVPFGRSSIPGFKVKVVMPRSLAGREDFISFAEAIKLNP